MDKHWLASWKWFGLPSSISLPAYQHLLEWNLLLLPQNSSLLPLFFNFRRLASAGSSVNNSPFSHCGTKRVHHHPQWFCRYFAELSVMTESVIGLFLQTYWFDWIFGGFIFYLCGASGTLCSAVVFQHLCGHFEVHVSVPEALISHDMCDLVYI